MLFFIDAIISNKANQVTTLPLNEEQIYILDGQPEEENRNMTVARFRVILSLLNLYPLYSVMQTDSYLTFVQLAANVVKEGPYKKELKLYKVLVDIFVTGVLAYVNAENNFDDALQITRSFIQSLLELTLFPSFTRKIALKIIIIFGYLTSDKNEKEEIIWKPEWLEMLNQFYTDEDHSSRKKFLKTNPAVLKEKYWVLNHINNMKKLVTVPEDESNLPDYSLFGLTPIPIEDTWEIIRPGKRVLPPMRGPGQRSPPMRGARRRSRSPMRGPGRRSRSRSPS